LGVTCDGEREVLGLWWQETEGAKFWLAVLNDLEHRGVDDVLICCVDGLQGFPEAIEATFPQAWVQTCIVHLIRASLRYVNYRDRKKVASALRPIYTAPNAEAAAWRTSWEHVIPFLSLPASCRRPFTPPTPSKGCTARSARRSRPAGTSLTNRPPPS
jgi:putative transposase